MTKTCKELNILVSSINNVIGGQETKVQKKLFKIYEKFKHYQEDYQSKIEDLRLDNAQVDEKDCLLLDDKGGYKFTKESIKKLTKQIKELSEKSFDFKPVEVINPNGLEIFTFLEDWTEGISFIKEEEEQL